MIQPSIPNDDCQRVAALTAANLLETPSEEAFDRVTRLAQAIFKVPIALVSLVDAKRQWFKSRQGLEATETPREISFCGHAILGDDILIVEDASRDERFHDNPLVAGDPHIRFYAGCPVRAPNGHRIGTLCIIGREARQLRASEAAQLRDLAGIVEQEMAWRALAAVDPPTGLANRRGFEMLAEHCLRSAGRTGEPVSLLFLDLDRFKQVNDELGHAAGDALLVEMSGLLQEVFRVSDVVARLGGDEFCVLLTGTPAANLSVPLQRLADRTAKRNGFHDSVNQLRYSAGVVSRERPSGDLLMELLAEADRAMYEQKRSRARVGGERGLA
jgi:diguanylate cyclase (GGDEF)-like protein